MTALNFPHASTMSRDYVKQISVVRCIDLCLIASKEAVTIEEIADVCSCEVKFVKAHLFHLSSPQSSSKHRSALTFDFSNNKVKLVSSNSSISRNEALQELIVFHELSQNKNTQKFIANIKASDKEMLNAIDVLPTNKFSSDEVRKLNKLI